MSYVIPYIFFDPPLVVDCSVTPIPASSSLPLQVIADSGINTGVGFQFVDSTGDLIGVYTGLPGQEKLICIVGNGISGQAWGNFPAHSRVSLRAMKNQQITANEFAGALVTI